MATSGLLVKNAAVSLVNGVYNKYDDDDNGRRWLSSDKLCLMHFTRATIKKKVDVSGLDYVTAEMLVGDRRYYKYNKLNNEYYPISLELSQTNTIDDQIGNNEKHLVANSLSETPRQLTENEIALGESTSRVYWLCDITETSTSKAEDFYISPSMLRTVKTIESRTKEVSVTGNVEVTVRFTNLAQGDNAYITIDDGDNITAVDGIVHTTAIYGATITAYVLHNGQTSPISVADVVQYALDRAINFIADCSDNAITLSNQNAYDQETYTAALYYSEPIYTLCEEINMNHWSISRVKLDDLGLTLDGDLYYAFAESEDTSPYDGLPWILLDGDTTTLDSNLKVEYWDESSVQSNTITTTDPDGAIRTVTTFVNIITGETYTDTQVVREKVVSVPVDVKRYDYVNLAVGKIYRFRFVSEFAKLGWIPNDTTQAIDAGIYKVDKIMSYYDSVIGRIDLFVNLYEPCGVSKAQFDDDKKRFADTTIYRLVSPNDASKVYFMPAIFIEGQPDASVLKYNKLLLMIDLGIQPNSETVKSLIANGGNAAHPAVMAMNDIDGTDEKSGLSWLIKQILEKEYGLVPTNTNPLIKFSVYGHTWLSDEGFNNIATNRAVEKAKSTVDYNTLFNLAESNKWYLENQVLRDKINHLDAMIQQILARRMEN